MRQVEEEQIKWAQYYNSLAMYYQNMAGVMMSDIGKTMLQGPPVGKEIKKRPVSTFDWEKRN